MIFSLQMFIFWNTHAVFEQDLHYLYFVPLVMKYTSSSESDTSAE